MIPIFFLAMNVLALEERIMVYGYARVSTGAQKVDRQIDELHKAGLADSAIFIDKDSGKDFVRTNYQKLKRRLKPGDVLFVKSIDRLGGTTQ